MLAPEVVRQHLVLNEQQARNPLSFDAALSSENLSTDSNTGQVLNEKLGEVASDFLDTFDLRLDKQGLTDAYCKAATRYLSQMMDCGFSIDPNIERSVMKSVLLMNSAGLRSAPMSEFATVFSKAMEHVAMPSVGNRAQEIVLFARSEEENTKEDKKDIIEDARAALAKKLLLQFGDKPYEAKAA